jgi:hypothetical protein
MKLSAICWEQWRSLIETSKAKGPGHRIDHPELNHGRRKAIPAFLTFPAPPRKPRIANAPH